MPGSASAAHFLPGLVVACCLSPCLRPPSPNCNYSGWKSDRELPRMSLDPQAGPSQLKRRQSNDGTHSGHHGLVPKRARWQLSTSTSPTPSRDLSSSAHTPGTPLDPLDYDTPMPDGPPISSLPTLAVNRDDDPIICFGAIGRLPYDFGAVGTKFSSPTVTWCNKLTRFTSGRPRRQGIA